MRITELSSEKLGNAVWILPLISKNLGHKHVKSSVQDYLDAKTGSAEQEFIHDVFTMKTNDIIEKWFDGEEAAADLWMKINN
jgi:hypothetical protein